ncbi:hypothetical protein SAMD00023353_0402200 [Rosellinia necatrix]|uniref:Uncharacterized protein n=1 Tax=Rosellinia necatrix TaxID=77044 RepID=A0A1S7UIY7_ROSNE|nr:hypothetical protein SAMD00023353_0402200 [Rosellinia necatrix]
MDGMRGSSPPKSALGADSPEQLLDAFKAAALSVTKLYKTSAAAQAKSRSDGYQDCLDDLLTFLDKRHIGLGDGEGWQIRKWATERLDGRDLGPQATDDDEDENDKAETVSSPELPRLSVVSQPSAVRNDSTPPIPHHPVVLEPVAEEPQMITVPTQDSFTFQSSHPYPHESYLNIANLDLSDSMRTNDPTVQGPPSTSVSQPPRIRKDKRGPRPRGTATAHLGRGAGHKRPINLAELFDVGSLNFGKDISGREGKRSRHT